MHPTAWSATLRSLLDLFDEHSLVACFQAIPADVVPEPSRSLLAHEQHMTLAMERHYRQPVRLEVVAERRSGATYARRSLLRLTSSDRVVQHCTVRIDLAQCSASIQAAIANGETPLGYILIEHDVMRRIVPSAFLRIRGAVPIAGALGTAADAELYGRVATIDCNGRQAIEVLEIVAPQSQEPA